MGRGDQEGGVWRGLGPEGLRVSFCLPSRFPEESGRHSLTHWRETQRHLRQPLSRWGSGQDSRGVGGCGSSEEAPDIVSGIKRDSLGWRIHEMSSEESDEGR